ncbi:uncharacterized protein LOC143074492 [Mytilus galloprovincialis]|uniref:uncharacterized protein LOC143074492 n=1 Tax=Mytilus galloprovincialis TaxID=29158 RepID=UPI003F7BF8DB
MKQIVFHHCTTSASAAAIKESGVINQSKTKPNGLNVNHGEGTYDTPLGPENGRMALALNNYGTAWQHFENMGRVDVVIRIVMDDSKVKHISVNGREIYVYSEDINLNEADEVDFIYFTNAGKYEVKKYK